MDNASRALTQGTPLDVPKSYRALADYSGVPRSTLHSRAHGRRSIEEKAQGQQYLTLGEEKAVIGFLLQMSELGRPVRIKHIPSIAFSATRHRPVSERPAKPPGKNWAKGLESRHPELQSKRVGALDWKRHENYIYPKTKHWYTVIEKVLRDPAILAENVYNMDETGVMLSMHGSVKVLVGRDDMRSHRGTQVNRTTITAIECISADGRYLNPLIIWPAVTHRSNWTTFPTPGWHYACSESGYTNSNISLEWLKRVFDRETRERASSKPRVLICDGFGIHETVEVLEFCFANDIVLCRLPSHTSHKLQPCDVAVFAPLKAAYRERVERMERAGVNTIGKQHFTSLYSPAREAVFTKRNILAGWSKAGLFPFNPERVLRDMPQLSPEVSTRAGGQVVPYVQDTAIPKTPATPVSMEALMSLQKVIVGQDAQNLDEAHKQSLERHIHKLAKAAQCSFAETAIQRDQIRFLLHANNDAKVRRSTKSTVLGKAKVMSFEDLVEARVKRAEKEAAKSSKRKRGRESKGATSDTDEESKKQRVRSTEEGFVDFTSYRAPVARMV